MDDLRIGATPRELVPGDVEAIAQLGRRLQDIAVGCEDAASQLRGLQAGDWQGEAAEAFADVLDQEPGRYTRAAGAFHDAAFAVQRYATTLEDAQQQAHQAITLFEEARARQARVHQAEAAAEGPAVAPKPEVEDPDIARACALLADAREQLEHEADIAARRLSDAAEAAPNKPGWGSRLLHGAGEFFGGVGEGLIWGVGHPVDFAKAVADWDTWKESPARAAGRLVPDIALILASAGAGAGGRGIRATERAADAADDARAVGKAAKGAHTGKADGGLAEHKPLRSSAMDDQRRLRLQRDWDQGGAITPNSIKEAEIGEDLESPSRSFAVLTHGLEDCQNRSSIQPVRSPVNSICMTRSARSGRWPMLTEE